jgi:hypothetical protein
MTQYTRVNNGDEDVVSAVVISRVWSHLESSDSWEVGQFNTCQHEDSFQLELEVNLNAVNSWRSKKHANKTTNWD